MTNWNTKCRFFNENFACDTLTTENLKSCQECKFSSQYSKKILIIKLGALGDVLRTTPILTAIKEKYPESLIYWLVEDLYGEGKELLEDNPCIDKILVLNAENILRLEQEKFDIVFSLEISTPGTLLANKVQADEKFGYYFNNGSTSCYNKGAEEYLETAFLAHIKIKNRKSYQELIFQACELEYKKEEMVFELSETDKKYGDEFKKRTDKKILGINFGSGGKWPSKALSKEKSQELINKTKEKYSIILLGGPNEEKLITQLSKENPEIISNNPHNTIKEFASVLSVCDKIITTDSLALHLSVALKKPTYALFFSTPPWEIENYENVNKIVSPLLEKYFFSKEFSSELANSISVDEILISIE